MILKPGMILSMEPHISIPEYGGYRDHDIIMVTEHGNEILTNYKYGPNKMII